MADLSEELHNEFEKKAKDLPTTERIAALESIVEKFQETLDAELDQDEEEDEELEDEDLDDDEEDEDEDEEDEDQG